MTQDSDKHDSSNKAGILGVLQTVLGAVFGIQSEKKRQEDFAKADPGKLIAIGIVTVIIIMVTMALIVRSALESAGH
ncbi:MAG TPA: DUF2970 domain-containing protein [Candidatus Kapabacteria bacterium]|nr:DUF2970 domain-containing protein [Candidatus Kapabacteria bacterium]